MSDYNPQDQQYNQVPPQQYYAPPPPPPPAAPDNKGKAVAALVIGIIALAFAWWGWVSLVGLVLSIVGLILSVGVRKENNPATKGLATGGLICSIIALVFSSIFFISCAVCTACAASTVSGLDAALSDWENIFEGF